MTFCGPKISMYKNFFGDLSWLGAVITFRSHSWERCEVFFSLPYKTAKIELKKISRVLKIHPNPYVSGKKGTLSPIVCKKCWCCLLIFWEKNAPSVIIKGSNQAQNSLFEKNCMTTCCRHASSCKANGFLESQKASLLSSIWSYS